MTVQRQMPRLLPRVQIVGRAYYQDDRLREFRAIHNPYDVLTFEFIDPADPLIKREPPPLEHETPATLTLRNEVADAARTLADFGLQLFLKNSIPEFEDELPPQAKPAERRLHETFWQLQHDYADAVQELTDAVAEAQLEQEQEQER